MEKQLLNVRNASVSHCVKNSSLTIIWNNLGLSNYKQYEKEAWIKKKKKKNNTCYNFKRNYVVSYSKESSYSYAFVTSLNNSIVLGRIFFWTFIERCFLCFFLNSRFLLINLIRQTKLFQMILSDKFLKQSDTETFLKFNSCFSTEFER